MKSFVTQSSRPTASRAHPSSSSLLRSPPPHHRPPHLTPPPPFRYERSSIQKWFSLGNTTSPKSGAPLPSKVLVPNHDLRARVQEWEQVGGWGYDGRCVREQP